LLQRKGCRRKRRRGRKLPGIGASATMRRSDWWPRRHWWRKWWLILVAREGKRRNL